MTQDTYDAVRRRDFHGCIAPAIPLAPRALEPCRGPIELDHIHNRGHGRRGPSRRWNLVSLCQWHHRVKTDNAKAWRKHESWYVLTFEPTALTDPEARLYLPPTALAAL